MYLTANNMTTLWHDAVSQVLEFGHHTGSRDGATKEVLGATLRLTDIDRNFVLSPIRKVSPTYANAELLWYLSGTDRIEMIKHYAPQYERFAEAGIAYGAYGARIQGTRGGQKGTTSPTSETFSRKRYDLGIGSHGFQDQFDIVLEILKKDPESRQAVVQLWRDGDLIEAYTRRRKDLPCTLSVQFLLRNRALHCFVSMRSNDLWIGTPYDIYCWTSIQRLLADTLGVKYGEYVHTAGSLHVYDRNRAKAESVRNNDDHFLACELGHFWEADRRQWEQRQAYVQIEEKMRRSKTHHLPGQDPASLANLGQNLLSDALAFCCLENPHHAAHSRLLRKGHELCL